MQDKVAEKILEKNRKDYKKIASTFSQTRTYPWEEMHTWAELAHEHDHVLDIGCGNGRLFPLIQKCGANYTGLDNSKELLDIAKTNYPQANFKQASILELPFKDNSFDIIYCIATLHHIPSQKLQLKALTEIERVLKPGGKVLLTTWNLFQPKYFSYLLYATFSKLLHPTKLDRLDAFIPWKDQNGKIVVARYCHAFTCRKLKYLALKAKLKVESCHYTKRNTTSNMLRGSNIVLVATKPET